MKTVRLKDNVVWEVIPDYALPAAQWYGEAFAAQCVEAPDEVEQHWRYDPGTGAFIPPAEDAPPVPEPTAQEDTDALLVEHEYRLTLLELGLGEGV